MEANAPPTIFSVMIKILQHLDREYPGVFIGNDYQDDICKLMELDRASLGGGDDVIRDECAAFYEAELEDFISFARKWSSGAEIEFVVNVAKSPHISVHIGDENSTMHFTEEQQKMFLAAIHQSFALRKVIVPNAHLEFQARLNRARFAAMASYYAESEFMAEEILHLQDWCYTTWRCTRSFSQVVHTDLDTKLKQIVMEWTRPISEDAPWDFERFSQWVHHLACILELGFLQGEPYNYINGGAGVAVTLMTIVYAKNFKVSIDERDEIRKRELRANLSPLYILAHTVWSVQYHAVYHAEKAVYYIILTLLMPLVAALLGMHDWLEIRSIALLHAMVLRLFPIQLPSACLFLGIDVMESAVAFPKVLAENGKRPRQPKPECCCSVGIENVSKIKMSARSKQGDDLSPKEAPDPPDMLELPKKNTVTTDLGRLIRHGDIAAVQRAVLEDPSRLEAPVTGRGDTPLLYALRFASRNSEMVQWLVRKGAAVNAKNKSGTTPLLNACRKASPEIVAMLIDHGAHINTHAIRKWTPLHCACNCKKTQNVELLLDRAEMLYVPKYLGLVMFVFPYTFGYDSFRAVRYSVERRIDLNAQNEYGKSALMYASRHGDHRTLKRLMDYGAALDLQDENGRSALMHACINDQSECARLLIDHGAKLDLQDHVGGTALAMTCKFGDLETLRLLLAQGASVDQKFRDGWTALMLACVRGISDFVQLLIDYGADPNLQNGHGSTALMKASALHTDVVTILIEAGASLDLQNTNGSTALSIACWEAQRETATLLVKHGASLNLQDKTGSSALIVACSKGDFECAKVLVEYGAALDLQDLKGSTALMYACDKNDTVLGTFLVEHAAALDLQDNHGLTALMIVCESKEPDQKLAASIVSHGAALELQENNGKTALHIACEFKQIEIVRVLLNHGANLNVKTHDGHTPLGLVAYMSDDGVSIARLLLKGGAAADASAGNDGWNALGVACYFCCSNLVQMLLEYGADVDVGCPLPLTPLLIATAASFNQDVATDPLRCAKLCWIAGANLHLTSAEGMDPFTFTRMEGLYDAAEFFEFVVRSPVAQTLFRNLHQSRRLVVQFFNHGFCSMQSCEMLSDQSLRSMGVLSASKREEILQCFASRVPTRKGTGRRSLTTIAEPFHRV
ncbi:Ankyrin repeat domain-containing protein 50 [Hondaea fermentalgiana]|uniref:Ankyrin repeat domain-containing protein 50 n=1 Tax=Hondaea fermentalgiana TaxID=2315210 RepID=A0A2R5GHX8_9STRA|nr:Ankyrin repeat domain-containing protein 50 [Hondaea fermentalgiana]|eukprot:GBG30195.1 Ankyrin repeat domain-containing protein 50 [Hondaea fermentalgiana]